MDLVKHITSFLEKHVPDYTSRSYLVAVSGGVDSMVLLHALQCLDLNISVAHVNYQLRGTDSDLDAELVKNYCNAKNLKHFQFNADISNSEGIQEEARAIRYKWFEELMAQEKLSHVFTAHHSDDQAETILQKLSRGTGLAGAAGIKPINGTKLRPLLAITKESIQTYATKNEVPFRTDASNAKNTYTRNRIRNVILPELELVNTNSKKHIAEFSHIASQAEALAKATAKTTWDSNSRKTEQGYYLNLTPWISSSYSALLLHYILTDLNVAGSYTNEIHKLCFSDSGKKVMTDEFTIWKNREELFFQFSSQKESDFNLEVNSEGIYDLPSGKLELSIQNVKEPLKLSADVIYFPLEKLTWPLKVRRWKAGDSFQPFGMKGRQKVSDLLIQKKIPVSQKDTVLVLEHLDELIWIIGLRSSECTRVSLKNTKALKILLTT